MALSILISSPLLASGQTVIHLSDPEVHEYEIRLEKIGEIHADPGIPSPVSLFTRVVETRQGNLYLAPSIDPHRIVKVTAMNSILEEFGSGGSGPGEFRSIDYAAIGPNDSLLVIDMLLRRASVFYSDKFVRTYQISVPPSRIACMSDGRLLVNSVMPTADGKIPSLRILDPTGSVAFAFDYDPEKADLKNRHPHRRVIDVDSDGTVWGANINRYRIKHFDSSGTLLHQYEKKSTWIEPWESLNPREPIESPPSPRIASIQRDGEDLLWVTIRVAGVGWQPSRADHSAIPSAGMTDNMFDTVIEVIDLKQGKTIASTRFDRNRAEFIASRTLHELSEDRDGDTVLLLWKASVVPARAHLQEGR